MRSRLLAFTMILALALVLVIQPSAAHAASIDWQVISGVGSNDLNDVIYGGGRYVAVGTGGTILTSADGTAWTRQVSGTTWDLRRAAYGNGLFLIAGRDDATGRQILLTSTDASTWTMRPFTATDEPINGIAYGNGRYVFVGGHYAVTSTTDFVTWQTPLGDFGVDPKWTLQGIAYGPDPYGKGEFVAVGDSWITSADGLKWTLMAPRSAGRAVTYAAGAFYAQGGYVAGAAAETCTPEMSESLDGTYWWCRGDNPPLPGAHWISLAFGAGQFVFAGAWSGGRGLVASSDGGNTWVSYPQSHELTKVIYGAQHFVAVGARGTILVSQAFPLPPIPSEIRRGYVPNPPPAQFSDLSSDHWAFKPISILTAVKVMVGYPDTSDPNAGEIPTGELFRPDASITRAEFLTMLVRLFPARITSDEGAPFTDVPSGHWAYDTILKARHAGIATGDEKNQFHPDDPITRAEMATLLDRCFHLDDPSEAISYIDITPSFGWARPHIEKLAAYGLITGFPDGTFKPGATATRAQAAAMLARFYS